MNTLPVNVVALVHEYNSGNSIQKIAALHNISAGLVSHYLKGAGIDVKPGRRKKVVPVAATPQATETPEDSRAALKRAILRFVEENL